MAQDDDHKGRNKSNEAIKMDWISDESWYKLLDDGYTTRKIRLQSDGHDWLAIVSASTSEGPVVAFMGAGTLRGLVNKLVTAIRGGGLKWREDRPLKE